MRSNARSRLGLNDIVHVESSGRRVPTFKLKGARPLNVLNFYCRPGTKVTLGFLKNQAQ